MAQFAYNDLGLRRMAAIHDGDLYTTGLTGAFTTAFEELGGSVAVASEETRYCLMVHIR